MSETESIKECGSKEISHSLPVVLTCNGDAADADTASKGESLGKSQSESEDNTKITLTVIPTSEDDGDKTPPRVDATTVQGEDENPLDFVDAMQSEDKKEGSALEKEGKAETEKVDEEENKTLALKSEKVVCNDLENSTSDPVNSHSEEIQPSEEEKVENIDDLEETIEGDNDSACNQGADEGTCSRSRPYVRTVKPNVNTETDLDFCRLKGSPPCSNDKSDDEENFTLAIQSYTIKDCQKNITPVEKVEEKSESGNSDSMCVGTKAKRSQSQSECGESEKHVSNNNPNPPPSSKAHPNKEQCVNVRDSDSIMSENETSSEESPTVNSNLVQTPTSRALSPTKSPFLEKEESILLQSRASEKAKPLSPSLSPSLLDKQSNSNNNNESKFVGGSGSASKPQSPDHKDKRLRTICSPPLFLPPHHSFKSEKEFVTSGHSGSTSISGSNNPCNTTGSRKGSKIPVGIAVAWQRLVTTSNSTLHSSTSTTDTTLSNLSLSSNHEKAETTRHVKEMTSFQEKGGTPPLRHSSASPISVSFSINSGTSSSSGRANKNDNNKSSSRKSGRCSASPSPSLSLVATGVGGGLNSKTGGVETYGSSSGSSAAKRAIAVLESHSKSLTPDLTTLSTSSSTIGGTCRPLPSSSVPPNLGLPYFHHQQQQQLDYHYGIGSMRSVTPYPTAQNLSFPPTWHTPGPPLGLGLGTDLTVPQGFSSPVAYLQQTMHNQLQLHHHHHYFNQQQQQQQQQQHHFGLQGYPTSLSSQTFVPPGPSTAASGYSDPLSHAYEQFIRHQRQQSEYLRQIQLSHFQQQHVSSALSQSQLRSHHQHQLLLSSGLYHQSEAPQQRPTPTTFPPTPSPRVVSIPLLTPSPTTGGIRTPTPNSLLGNPSHHSNLSAIGAGPPTTQATLDSSSTNWPTDSYFPHNSSAALSPRSLTSSSPSPVTVQQQVNNNDQLNLTSTVVAGGRERTSTSSVSRGGAPFPSPPLLPGANGGRGKLEHASSKGYQSRTKHPSMSPDKDLDDKRERGTAMMRGYGESETSIKTMTFSKPPVMHPTHDHHTHAGDRVVSNRSDKSVFPSKIETINSKIRHDFKRLDSLIERRESVDMSHEKEELCKTPPTLMMKSEDKSDSGDSSRPSISTTVASSKIETERSHENTKLATLTFSNKEAGSAERERSGNNVTDSLGERKEEKGALKRKSLSASPSKSNSDLKSIPRKRIAPVLNVNSDDDGEFTASKPKKRKKSIDAEKGKAQLKKGKKKVDGGQRKLKTEGGKKGSLKDQKGKDKKGKSRRPSSCDPHDSRGLKGNNVPETNLPVATSKIATSHSKSGNSGRKNSSSIGFGKKKISASVRNNGSNSINKKKTNPKRKKVGLSPTTQSRNVGGKITTTEMTETSLKMTKKKVVEGRRNEKSKITRVSGKQGVKEAVGKGKEKVKRVKEERKRGKKPVAIKSKGDETVVSLPPAVPTSLTTSAVIPNPQQQQHPPPITFPCTEGGTLNAFTLPPNNPVIPLSVPYHNSPVTLILPRILPQPTITNSHHQTSFKLVMSSQEIKMPASFVQSGTGVTTIEGTTTQMQTFQLHHHQEQNIHNTSFPSVSSIMSQPGTITVSTSTSSTSSTSSTATMSAATAASILVSPPCDGALSPGRGNTITFIRDSSMIPQVQHPFEIVPSSNHSSNISMSSSNSTLLRHCLPLPQPSHFVQDQFRPQIHHFHSPSSASSDQQHHHHHHHQVVVKKDFNPSDDSGLNILATVAQEFGSREDLGRLASHSSSSRGSSLMTSPIMAMQSPELNFPTPSSSASGNTTITSISLPPSPVSAKLTSRSPYSIDEHDFDNEKEEGKSGLYKSKNPVWLKIPQIIPQAANKAAEKLRKMEKRKQEKAKSVKSEKSKNHRKIKGKESITEKKVYQKEKKQKTEGSESHRKLNIPKTSSSATTTSKPRRMKEKVTDGNANNATTTTRKTKKGDPSFSMKMTLPVPKVAKLRIKLSETENPTLMGGRIDDDDLFLSSSSVTKTESISSKKQKQNRRHSEGDKVKVARRHSNYGRITNAPFKINSSKMSGKSTSGNNNKRKNYYEGKEEGESESTFTLLSPPKKRRAVNTRNKPISAIGFIQDSPHSKSQDLFPSSFSSITPPPTAKPPSKGPSVKMEQQNKESSLESRFPTSSFLSSNFNNNNNNQEENTKMPNWVADPLFAASALRTNKADGSSNGLRPNNNTSSSLYTEKVVGTKYERISSSDEDEEEILMDFERRSAERMRYTPVVVSGGESGEGKKSAFSVYSNTSSSNNINNAISPSQKNGDLKQQLKTFIPYTPKLIKARSHHIKPCLKPEPILKSASSEDDDDDEHSDIDFEVASITNSLPRRHPSGSNSNISSSSSSLLLRQRRGSQKEEASACSKSIKAVIQNLSKYRKEGQGEIAKRSLSLSSHAPVGRRLSLNLETGRTRTHDFDDESDTDESDEEEELLDIDDNYSVGSMCSGRSNPIGTGPRIKLSNSLRTYENKKQRKASGGSTATSISSASAFLPKTTMPKKRTSRSLTGSSRSSVRSSSGSAPVIRSSSSVSTAGAAATINSGSRRGSARRESLSGIIITTADVQMDETQVPGKIELESVDELVDEMRILTEIQGLFYTGKLNALQPPDVYGVTVDNERGAPPHLIFSAEEVLQKCFREKKPKMLTVGLPICAYWSPQYRGLFRGRVSDDFNPAFDPDKDLVPIEFDDGDTGMIKLSEMRLLPLKRAAEEYDPNPLLTLEKKHKKGHHACTGEHSEDDCGESYCTKAAKLQEEEDEEDEIEDIQHRPYKSLYWTWTGLGQKSKSKKNRNKEFFKGIQRKDEIINVGDSAIFVSENNERPYIGRIEKFWESKGKKVVSVRWYYHPEEVKSPKRLTLQPHALFESCHVDENDVQSIYSPCQVLSPSKFKQMNAGLKPKPKHMYHIAGFYDPYTCKLRVKV